MLARKQKSVSKPPLKKKSILIVDDETIFRAGLTSILGGQPDLDVGGEATDYTSGLGAIRTKAFDLVIVDLGLGMSADGLELMKSIRAEQPDLPVLIVSIRDESIYASRSLRAGASGYLMKREATSDSLLKALRHIFSGLIYLSSAMQQRIIINYVHKSSEAGTAVDLLSDRELEVLHLVGHGIETKQIAIYLNLSPKTVQCYRDRIRQKLVFANAGELARFAHDWVEDEEE